MPSDSKFTRDDDGNVAVRVVSNTGVSEQPESMFTTDEDGNVAVRVVFGEGGGGGGDSHNKGFYATPTALNEAVPTAEAGDFAIVGSTDTVWIWDTDNSEWVDSDQKGQVTSVNGQTGDVVLDLLPSQTGNAGKFLTTDGTDASWSDKPLVNTATGANSLTILGAPAIKSGCINIGSNSSVGSLTTGVVAIGADTKGNTINAIAIGNGAQVSSLVSGTGGYGIAIGSGAKTTGNVDVSIGMGAGRTSSTNHCKTCIGYEAAATAHGAYQFGRGTNSEAGTVCFSLNTTGGTSASDWHNYKLLDSDGTIPEARLADTTSAQEGDVLTLDSNGNAVWQAGSGGGLPDQTGQSGKFLTTDGTDASWSDKPLVNVATSSTSVIVLATQNLNNSSAVGIGSSVRIQGNYDVAIGASTVVNGDGLGGVAIGYQALNYGRAAVVIGSNAQAQAYAVSGISIGYKAKVNQFINYGIAIGNQSTAGANYAIQIGTGSGGAQVTNSDANTVKIANANGNFELMSADGTVPADRLVHAINKYSTMPTAASTNEGWIVQFTGTTDSTYTHGHLYECVSDGGNPATYSWTEVSMGGSSLPSQTGNAGKFLTTDGTDASWGNALANMATANNSISILSGTNISYPNSIAIGAGVTIRDTNCVTIGTFATEGGSGVTIGHSAKGSAQGVSIGYESDITGASNSTAIGYQAKAKSYNGIAIGRGTNTGSSSLGYYGNVAIGNGATIGNNMGATYQFGNSTNNEEGTVKFALSTDHGMNWTNYKLLDVDGTIPTDRLTKVNSTITLTSAGWSSNTQTVNVTGMTATGVVIVSPDPTDQSAYTSAGILCTAQAAGTLTFTCDTVPSGDIDVNVVML